MAIRIITDSASDILPYEAAGLGITVIPLTLTWDGREYRDAVDIDHETFFGRLEHSETLPTTSQVSPAAFEEAFAAALTDDDEVLVITLSSVLSGTCQSATIAAERFGGRVHVVDSLSATVGQRLLIQQAIRYIANGMSASQAAEALEKDRDRICVLAKIDTLKYLKKGGRISPTLAFAGELLSVKPVITIKGGAVEVIGKARGSKNGNNFLRKMINEVGGIDFTCPYCLVYSGLSGDMLKQYIDDSADLWSRDAANLPIATIGPVIGTHIGPNAIGLAFFKNQQ